MNIVDKLRATEAERDALRRRLDHIEKYVRHDNWCGYHFGSDCTCGLHIDPKAGR